MEVQHFHKFCHDTVLLLCVSSNVHCDFFGLPNLARVTSPVRERLAPSSGLKSQFIFYFLFYYCTQKANLQHSPRNFCQKISTPGAFYIRTMQYIAILRCISFFPTLLIRAFTHFECLLWNWREPTPLVIFFHRTV